MTAPPECDPERVETLRRVLLDHHPIMRSETGPFSGCRCGQVKLGQDVIAHVAAAAIAALPPSPAEEAVKPADEFLIEAARGWILRHTTQPGGDRWGYDPDHLAWAAENLLVDLAPWLNQSGRDEAEWQRAGDWHAGYAAGKAGAWGFIARLRAALASPTPSSQGEHRMLPGSHEQPGGPECRCGANWDRWNDRCTASPAPAPQEPACQWAHGPVTDLDSRGLCPVCAEDEL